MAGKDKGKKGKIIRVLPAKNKVVVEGLNMTKRHQRPRKSGEKGSMVNTAMPMSASNVQILDPKTGKVVIKPLTAADGAERALALQHTRPHTGPSAWWLFSSTEAATHLLRLCPDLPVQQGRALATHPRIAQGLRAQGWGRVELVAPGLDRLVESIESLA